MSLSKELILFIDKSTLDSSLKNLFGSASYMLRIWFVLKYMGLSPDATPVLINTSNSTEALKRLFSCGSPDGDLFTPFAHSSRYAKMKHDSSRSIIQTNIQRWASSGSVVGSDPTDYLEMKNSPKGELLVSTKRNYPLGLGYGTSGFAMSENERVAIPITSFAVWYGRTTKIPENVDPKKYLIEDMLTELNITESERSLIFVEDVLDIHLTNEVLSSQDIFELCSGYFTGEKKREIQVHEETFEKYSRKVRSMILNLEKPNWLRTSPNVELNNLISDGVKAILLYGPPRTGKTRIIDSLVPRNSDERCTIQIHDGWGYDNLVEGLRPDNKGAWSWHAGPLLQAIKEGKKWIVLEEINRTNISQSLGEVFSLIEDAYRGPENSILLRSGEYLYIPEDVKFIMTMNNIDKSTEEVDDALIGRLAAIEFMPSSESLIEMLNSSGVNSETCEKICQLFTEILNIYPLGHGYFSGLKGQPTNQYIIRYYKTRIRTVLVNYLGELQRQEIEKIDNLVDEMFK